MSFTELAVAGVKSWLPRAPLPPLMSRRPSGCHSAVLQKLLLRALSSVVACALVPKPSEGVQTSKVRPSCASVSLGAP